MSGNALLWHAQRVTGALLVVLLVAHFWVEHFATEPLLRGELTYEAIEQRIRTPLWQAIDIAFLAVALFHGLNGLRNIVLDYSRIPPPLARAVTGVLTAAGLLWMYWGVEAFRNL